MAEPSRIDFWCPGRPVQKGNHKALCPRCSFGRPGHPYIVDDWSSDLGKRLKAWIASVVAASIRARPSRPWCGAVEVHVVFYFVRPPSNADPFPQNSRFADGDKLERAVWDALQVKGKAGGRVIVDDCQVVRWTGAKAWGPEEGAQISVVALEPEQLALTDDAPLAKPGKPRGGARRKVKKEVRSGWF